jgi:hypothetical protein
MEAVRLEKKLANIEKQRNGGRAVEVGIKVKAVGVKDSDTPVKKEKLANKFQKNKDKKNEQKVIDKLNGVKPEYKGIDTYM